MSVDDAADRFLAFVQGVNGDSYFAVDTSDEVGYFDEYIAEFLSRLILIAMKIGWVPGRLPVDVIIIEALSLYEGEILPTDAVEAEGGAERPEIAEPPPEFLEFFEKNFEAALQQGVGFVCSEFMIDPRVMTMSAAAAAAIAKLALVSCLVDWVPEGYKTNCAGFVFAGFNPDTPFPVAREYQIYPTFGGMTKITDRKRYAVSSEFDNSAVIKTFAQTETLDSFLHKVSFRTRRHISNELKYYVSMMRRSASTHSHKMSPREAAEIELLFAGMQKNISEVIDHSLPRKSRNLRNTLANIRSANPQKLADLAKKSMQMIVHGEELAANDTVGRPVKILTLCRDRISSDVWE